MTKKTVKQIWIFLGLKVKEIAQVIPFLIMFILFMFDVTVGADCYWWVKLAVETMFVGWLLFVVFLLIFLICAWLKDNWNHAGEIVDEKENKEK